MTKRPTKAKPLTDRHRLFAHEYLQDLNASAAYRRVYGDVKNADTLGPRLKDEPEVAALIAELVAARASKLELSADRLLLEAMRLAYSDVGQLFAADGSPIHPKDLPEDVRRAISSIQIDEVVEPGEGQLDDGAPAPPTVHRKIKLRLWNKNESHNLLAKVLKLVVERREVDVGDATLDKLVELSYRLAGEAPPASGKAPASAPARPAGFTQPAATARVREAE